jgi:hypothetical protein
MRRREVHKILVRKPGKTRTFEDVSIDGMMNSRMDIMEIGWEGVDWINLAVGSEKWPDI